MCSSDLRLPIPEMTGEEIPVEWTYVFIPYRERHLTRYQKERFLRRYRQGKPMADSKTWKYRAAIHELKKLQEEFDFLAAYRIQDKAQLKAISDATKEQLWENSRARKQLRKEMVPYEEMLLLLNKLQEKQMEVLEAIKMFSDMGLNSTGGLSNNSNGMPKHIRPIMDSAMVAMAMMQGLTSAIVNPNDLRLMETIKSCDIIKNNYLYADSYLEL